MKRFLDDKICELAKHLHVSPEQVYDDERLYDIAVAYAEQKLLANALDATIRS